MSKFARVLDVREMAAFRGLLVKFSEAVRNGVAAGDAEVRDMQRWLTQEQPQVWARRIKKLERQLTDAKEALRRKQSTPTPIGEPPNVMLEKNQVRKVKALLEEAKERAQRTQLWGRRFEREESAYRGSTNGARSAAQSTLPTAIHTLDELMKHIDDYLRLTSQISDSGDQQGDDAPCSITRGTAEARLKHKGEVEAEIAPEDPANESETS
ncbi:MAG: hypothetical protein AAGH92_06660 [Planctomycetota bacterium]